MLLFYSGGIMENVTVADEFGAVMIAIISTIAILMYVLDCDCDDC